MSAQWGKRLRKFFVLKCGEKTLSHLTHRFQNESLALEQLISHDAIALWREIICLYMWWFLTSTLQIWQIFQIFALLCQIWSISYVKKLNLLLLHLQIHRTQMIKRDLLEFFPLSIFWNFDFLQTIRYLFYQKLSFTIFSLSSLTKLILSDYLSRSFAFFFFSPNSMSNFHLWNFLLELLRW